MDAPANADNKRGKSYNLKIRDPENMRVILSIKPEHAKKILDGHKKFEFRKNRFTRENIKSALIYATLPVGKIIGEFEIKKILADTPCKLWEKTGPHAGITKESYENYFLGKKLAVAIEIGAVFPYESPMNISDIEKNLTAPQSFRYIK